MNQTYCLRGALKIWIKLTVKDVGNDMCSGTFWINQNLEYFLKCTENPWKVIKKSSFL